MTTTYQITHSTTYTYEKDVSASYSSLHLLPRNLPGQRCLAADIVVEPAPRAYREHTDIFGNRVVNVALHSGHRSLRVTATSTVEVDDASGAELSLFSREPWELVRESARRPLGDDAVEIAPFVLDSPLVEASQDFLEYALPSFWPGRSLFEAVLDLSSRIHREFEFAPGQTNVDTSVVEVLESRKGVCQDFAHVAIACLRSLGLPARYVSGYIETDPPPGQARLVGVDASHAWLSVPIAGAGWVGFDPTNDQIVGQRYVITAYGRDYGDVAPVTGVIYTTGRTTALDVVVDVAPL
jgi:transglutaminase-like putative cysteine protease